MRGAATIHVQVEVVDRDGLVFELDGDPASWERTIVRKKDKFKALLGDGKAKVSASLSERIGGSHGYSSVSTNVSVSVQCNQDAKTIHEAGLECFEEAVAITEDIMPKAKKVLEIHLSRLYKEQ